MQHKDKMKIQIKRAQNYGMCFGVRDAIDLAREESKNGPMTILGDLVHNESVMSDLKDSGVEVERNIGSLKTGKVMITAHGASEKRIEMVKARGHEVIEATCPLVKHAHRSIYKLVDQGYYPVIIGKRGHVEVTGLTEDLEHFTIIEGYEEFPLIPQREKYGVASQTTQPITKVRDIVEKMSTYFQESEVKFVDTVCRPTKDRQQAAEKLAIECDTVLCVGGKDSNNTRQLKEKSQLLGARAYHIQGPQDIQREWFKTSRTIGITAGTSTPMEIVDAVEHRLEQIVHQLEVVESPLSISIPLPALG